MESLENDARTEILTNENHALVENLVLSDRQLKVKKPHKCRVFQIHPFAVPRTFRHNKFSARWVPKHL